MQKRLRLLLISFIILNVFIIAVVVYILVYAEQEDLPKWLQRDTANLKVDVNIPPSVGPGSEFRVVVHVENESKSEAQLKQVRLSQSLIQNVELISAFPEATSHKSSSGDVVYSYEIILSSGQGVDLIYTFRCGLVGDFRGEIEVKADGYRAVTQVRLVVLDIDPHNPPPTPTPTWIAPQGEIIPYESVVQITTMVQKGDELSPGWSASGVIVSEDGLILTTATAVLPKKNHPVDAILISMTEQPNLPVLPMYYAVVLQADPVLDLAVVLITTDLKGNEFNGGGVKLKPVNMGSSESLMVGDSIKLVGYPTIGQETIALSQAFIQGFSDNFDLILISATLAGGFSGGLAVNPDGELIGIPTQSDYRGENQYLDCRIIADANRDGLINSLDNCVPTGGFINTLRPVFMARPLIDAAMRGEVNIVEPSKPELSLPSDLKNVFRDDFSDSTSGWETFDRESGWGVYSNDEYRIHVKQVNTILWSVLGKNYHDAVVEVKTSIISPTGTGDRGIFCRYNGADHYYWFAVTEEGYYGIFLRAKGRMVPLLDWQFSRQISRYQPITMVASCIGDTLSLAVNGSVLGQVTDSTWSQGDIGLAAGTWGSPSLVAAFDDLKILVP